MANGMIIIDKPAGWTSMDVCAKLRGVFQERRVGHAGTLDPMATGVLPVFVGRATRGVEFTEHYGKEYVAGLRLGISTNTQDTSGEVLEQRPVTAVLADVEQVLEQFRGPIQQIPPMYSAIKIGGKKLYELARKGKEVARNPRDITIHKLELVEQTGETDYLLRISCSKGTYIRTLCHDIGQVLGCGGTMYQLRRTRVGDFDTCIPLDVVLAAAQEGKAEELLQPIDGCFSHLPSLSATDKERDKYILNGTPYPCSADDGQYRVYDPAGEFLMLGQVSDGVMTTVKSFFNVPTGK